MRLFFVMSLLLFLTLGPTRGNNVYVSLQGSDANDGSRETPYRTIAKAASGLWAGDTCFIMEGVYRETLIAGRSGKADQPIVFMAFEGDSVVLSATGVVEGWNRHDGTVYSIPASMTLGRQNMLYFNGKAMDWARWPNNADDNRFTIDASPIESGSASTVVDTDIPDLNWTGGYMWYLGAHSGASWTREIRGYDPATHTISFDAVDINKWPFTPHNPTVYRNGNRGRIFLFGTLDALDHPGEWYFDNTADTLYFIAPGEADPSLHETEIAQRSTTIQLLGDHVHVDGIHAFGGRVQVKGDHCVVRNGTFRHCMETLDELDNTNAQMNDGSIKIEGSNILIENNVIEYGSSNGIAMLQAWSGSKNNTARNNVIRHFNTIGIHSCGIRSSCPGTRIIGNSIYSCGRDGVYVSGGNSEIAYNDIYACMRINNDGGVFYTVGNQSPKNTEIHHNWCHDSYGPAYADGRAAGIYLDNDSKGYDVHHNVVWNVTWTALQMNWDNWYNDIVNNSFWHVGGAMGNWLNGRELIDNRIYNNYASSGSWVGNQFVANVLDPASPFSDVEGKDFTPKKGSVLIDQGVTFEGITTQVLGAAPDVGAYEYGLSPWRPGINHVVGGDTLSNLKVIFMQPQPARVFALQENIVVEAQNVNGEEGVVMSLYLDDVLVSADSSTPFIWDPAEYPALSGLPAGDHNLKILATDINGYAASVTTTFIVIAINPGDAFVLGNGLEEGTEDFWTSNMVINETDTYTNVTDTSLYVRVDSFRFHAMALADPVTPFLVRVNGDDDFTVLAIGQSRNQEEYITGSNRFPFREGRDTTLILAPGETIAPGFLDAYPDGLGGGEGPVIPYDETEPADRLWYSGGPAWYQSGSVIEGEAPVYDVPPRTHYLRNYHFNIGFTITDSIGTGINRTMEAALAFSVNPNPVFGGEVVLSTDQAGTPVRITLLDLQGRIIHQALYGENRIRLSTSLLQVPGTYIVRAESGHKIAFKKLVKL